MTLLLNCYRNYTTRKALKFLAKVPKLKFPSLPKLTSIPNIESNLVVCFFQDKRRLSIESWK